MTNQNAPYVNFNENEAKRWLGDASIIGALVRC
jgi:hypothetical protein